MAGKKRKGQRITSEMLHDAALGFRSRGNDCLFKLTDWELSKSSLKIESIIDDLSNSACKILLMVISRLNQYSELCRIEHYRAPNGKLQKRIIPVESYKEFYESIGVTKESWNSFMNQIEPYHLLDKVHIQIDAYNWYVNTRILFNPALRFDNCPRITLESAVTYYNEH